MKRCPECEAEVPLELMPWELWWQNKTDEDFMRQPGEGDSPIRVRMAKEAASVGGRVLDVGCGTAIDYPRLTSLGLEYKAIEPIPKFIARAREFYPDIDIRQARVWNLPFEDDSFDVVYCSGVVQHLPPGTYPEALDEMWRVAKTLLLVSTNRAFTDDSPGILHRIKGGAYDNHYNFWEFRDHVRSLKKSISKIVRLPIGGSELEHKLKTMSEETIRRYFLNTLFVIYDLDYWRKRAV